MESGTLEFTLPPAPRGLCFDRNDFVKTNFSVDIFLAEHQNVVSLETMRDDLGVYLKVLRLAMIELINKDYANFVNLSATLIGFDKAIEKIQVPLGNLNEEVLGVKQCLEEAMKELSMWMNQRTTLLKKKQLLKHYSQTLNSLTTLESILKILSDSTSQEKITLADRGVMQYNQLKFTISKCETLLKNDHKELFKHIGEKLTQTLNDLLFQYWNENDESNLLKALITLASLDRVRETEMLIRKKAIAPLLQDVINEPALQRNQDGLQGIYNKILSILNEKLKVLLSVMQHSKLLSLAKRYRFLVNCFWCEVESRLEINLASIFAPGNPKIFYQRYNESMLFINKLESYCSSKETVELLHDTPEYKSFQKRWNLPVYFQIRFQEIAGAFEATLYDNPTVESNESGFILKETHHCWKSLQDCWSDGVYIDALAHKFWKLTLHLLSRYATWVVTLCSQKPTAPKLDNTSVNKELIGNSINLYIDIQRTLQRLPQFLQMVENKIKIQNKELIRQSLKPTEDVLLGAQKKIRDCIVNELFANFSSQLKQVSDIPRLYRKTNRSIPTKPCTYIEVVTKSIQDFHKDASQRLDNLFLIELYETLFNVMTNTYYKNVEDVLTSVQKTEESLRRLKQIREGTQQSNDSGGVTDGDKIRLQLNVDVVAYGKMADSLHINVNNIDKFMEITTMVTQAVKNIEIK